MSRTDHARPPRTRPRTEVLYARLPAELIEWIRQQAGHADVSMAQAAGMMLAYCQQAGLQLERPVPAAFARASGPLAQKPSA